MINLIKKYKKNNTRNKIICKNVILNRLEKEIIQKILLKEVGSICKSFHTVDRLELLLLFAHEYFEQEKKCSFLPYF